MTLTDLVICGLVTARLTSYFETAAYETSRNAGGADFKPDHQSLSQPWLWTLIRVQVYLRLSQPHWAALSVLLILKLADSLPTGWALFLQLPVYALAVGGVSELIRQASRALRPNTPLKPF